MRHTYVTAPPQGFIVFDDDGHEVRRWFDTVRGDTLELVARRALAGPFKTKSVRHMENSLRRILVIDDDKSVRLAIEFLFGRQGYQVVCTDNGRHAIGTFTSSEFDVVMVDMFMPGMDGIEVIKLLRRRAAAIPIIAMSGYKSIRHTSAPTYLGWAAKLGATYCLHNPFSPKQLSEALDSCFIHELPISAQHILPASVGIAGESACP